MLDVAAHDAGARVPASFSTRGRDLGRRRRRDGNADSSGTTLPRRARQPGASRVACSGLARQASTRWPDSLPPPTRTRSPRDCRHAGAGQGQKATRSAARITRFSFHFAQSICRSRISVDVTRLRGSASRARRRAARPGMRYTALPGCCDGHKLSRAVRRRPRLAPGQRHGVPARFICHRHIRGAAAWLHDNHHLLRLALCRAIELSRQSRQ